MLTHLKSRIWVEALLRLGQSEGKFGAVIHTGADEAGAVYVTINHLNNTYSLLGPAAGPSHSEAGDRQFRKVFSRPVTWDEVSAHIAKQRNFDSDIWLVEIEDRSSMAGLHWVAE